MNPMVFKLSLRIKNFMDSIGFTFIPIVLELYSKAKANNRFFISVLGVALF